VGAPPIRTGAPFGIGRTMLVGRTSDRSFVFFLGLRRGGGGMPIDWQERQGSAI
jgi:hypothetical protein